MAKCEKILICGFSGAGKTSFTQELRLSSPDSTWTFTDLDQLIMRSQGQIEVAQIIEKHGWDLFRLWERQQLEDWLNNQEVSAVLSLGGGTLSQDFLDSWKPTKKIRICYLHAPFEDCWERLCLSNSETRPLVRLGKAQLQRIYEERSKVFQQVEWRLENPKGSNLSQLAGQFWESIASS